MKQAKQELIAEDLLQKIERKIYRPGDYLPSENQLCDLYGTSRETIRRALNSLQEMGQIQKIRGKGSVVLEQPRFKFPVSGITSFQELNQQLGMHAQTKVLLEEETTPPAEFAGYQIAAKKATHLQRLRLINSEPVVFDEDYLLNPPLEHLPKDIAQKSVYEYLENELGWDISYARKVITVEEAPDYVKEALELEDGLCVIVRSVTYLADTTMFQLTSSYHLPAKFQFIDFARRQKIKNNR